VSNQTLSEQVERFWKQETIPEACQYTKEDVECETKFIETTERDEIGRFIVRLPVCMSVKLGDSKDSAYRRFIALERRLSKDPTLRASYVDFMQEYEQQGHMSAVTNENALESESYYLPHQAVVRPDSVTTKLRVVFDASAKTSTGNSLNDKLMTGPNLQKELINIIPF